MEDIIIPIVVFSFVFSMTWLFLSHHRWVVKQKQQGGAAEGNSLRTSELKALMRDAVEEAHMPLLARIERLEAAPPPAKAAGLLPLPEDRRVDPLLEADAEAGEPAPVPRRRVT